MKPHGVVMALVLAVLPGCRGCQKEPAVPPVMQRVEPAPPQTPQPVVEPPQPVTPVYAGPSSKARDGFQLSSGFLDETGKPLPQPPSGKQTAIYATALDPQSRPVGALQALGDVEMFGFLVARDLRHVLFATAKAPVREGADARPLAFTPPGGGDHALIAVFQPQGGEVHAVSSPVSVSGNLPQLAGPGLAGLKLQAQAGDEHVELVVLPHEGTATLDLQVHDVGADGKRRGVVQVPLVVLVDPPMGRALALLAHGEPAVMTWPQPEPGEWLALVPPKSGDQALAFHVTIAPPQPHQPPEKK